MSWDAAGGWRGSGTCCSGAADGGRSYQSPSTPPRQRTLTHCPLALTWRPTRHVMNSNHTELSPSRQSKQNAGVVTAALLAALESLVAHCGGAGRWVAQKLAPACAAWHAAHGPLAGPPHACHRTAHKSLWRASIGPFFNCICMRWLNRAP